jgi:cell division protein FtsI (penicillin-binding protein 3)
MKFDSATWTRFRLRIVLAAFVLAWAAVLYRAFELQILSRDQLAGQAERESHKVVELRPVRGEIHDRNGEKLAVSLKVDTVYAQPERLERPEAAARRLAGALNVHPGRLAARLKKGGSFAFVKRQITPDEADRIRDLDLDGVHFLKETKRFYPNNLLAGHLLGFVGVDNRGLEGLELAYDEYLRGGVVRCRVRRDAKGRTFLDHQADRPEKNMGDSLYLTLDRRIQYITETALARAGEAFEAKSGTALVMRPQTGEVLASAVWPGFNPNVFGRFDPGRRRNRIVTDAFDPGSTFKVFVVAAAIEEGVVDPEERIDCERGRLAIGSNVIRDHHEYDVLTVKEVIKHSSNIGTAKIGARLGSDGMYQYLRRFNFGLETGIDFPGESAGMLRAAADWHELDAANVAFGQGVTVTALQMAAAMGALANGGWVMRPYVVDRVVDQDGRVVKRNKPKVIRRAVSGPTVAAVREMLRMVVLPGGTGTRADSPAYPAAGKTGTAQKLDPETGGYSQTAYVSSFVGFVPYDRPELVIFVAFDEPRKSTYGGVVAGPVFREIAEKSLPLLDVPPVGGRPEVRVASAATEVQNKVTVQIDQDRLAAVRALAAQIHKEEFDRSRDTDPKTSDDALAMPDLEGLSMGRVLDTMGAFDVCLKVSGSGQAVWQKPRPGQTLQPGQVCQVKFEQW